MNSRTLAQARNRFHDDNESNSEEEATRVNRPRRHVLIALLSAAAVIGFNVGNIATAFAAKGAVTHRYTLRVGDRVTIPAINQRCAVYMEGGAPELYCARPLHPRHQVTIFRDRIQVWKAGDPDAPVWSGRP